MSFKDRSQARTSALAQAIETYHQQATAERLFKLNDVTTLPAQTRLRNDEQVTQDLAQLDLEIKQLQASRQVLATAEANLGVWRARSRNLLSPISMLPNEILGQIFVCSLPRGRELVEFTTAVSTVCRLWREIALRFRALWSVFNLRWHSAREKAWLERSSGHPLSIYVDFPGPLGEDHLLSAVDFRGLFRQDGVFCMAENWISAEFHIGTSYTHLNPIMSYLPKHCTGLRSLTIADCGFSDSYEDAQMLDVDMWPFVHDMPNLTEIVIRSVYAINLHDLVPRLRVLKTNTVGAQSGASGSVRRWMDLFRQAAALEDLEADWNRLGSRKHRAPPPWRELPPLDMGDPYWGTLAVSSLRRLKLHCIDWRVCKHLFECIQLPELESISIEFDKVTFTSRSVFEYDLEDALFKFFSSMSSIKDAAFKALPETLSSLLNSLTRGLYSYSTSRLDPVRLDKVPLFSLQNLTLWAFVGSYNLFNEPVVARESTRAIPDLLERVCVDRARARKPIPRDAPRPTLLDDIEFGHFEEDMEWETFHIIELRGIHCNSEWRQKLAKYTRELMVDDPLDIEPLPTSPDSDGYYSSEEEELWQAVPERASEGGDSQRWHSSDASYTDEAAIDDEESADEDVDEDAGTDDLNINAWGLADVPSELDDNDEALEFLF